MHVLRQFLATLIAIALFTTPAHAQDAGDLVQRATELFSAGEFEEAAELFAEAFELDPHPVIMFNLARAHQEMGDLPGALNYLEIIRTMDAPVHVAEAADAKITEVEGLLIAEGYDPATVTSITYIPRGNLTLTTQPEGAEVFIAGEYAGRTPFVRDRVDEGTYTIRVELEGYHPINQDIEIASGRMNLRAFTLNERTQIAEYVPPDPGYLTVRGPASNLEVLIDGEFAGVTPILAQGMPPGAYSVTVRGEDWNPYRTAVEVSSNEETEVTARMEPIDARVVLNPNRNRTNAGTGLMAAAGAVIAGGAVLGVLALNESSAYNDDPSNPDRGTHRNAARRNALIADVSFGVGGALLVTGALLRWANGGGSDIDQDLMVTPGPGLGLGLAAQF
jgi:hypothetical protein